MATSRERGETGEWQLVQRRRRYPDTWTSPTQDFSLTTAKPYLPASTAPSYARALTQPQPPKPKPSINPKPQPNQTTTNQLTTPKPPGQNLPKHTQLHPNQQQRYTPLPITHRLSGFLPQQSFLNGVGFVSAALVKATPQPPVTTR